MADATLSEDRPRLAGGTSTREDRLLAIDTPLGKDKLVLTELAGEEEISKPFSFSTTLRSEDPDIRAEDLIGAKVTIWVRRETAEPVPISGMVRSFSSASLNVRGFREYRAEIVPWLWFLSCTTDSRIFQNLTVPKIIETIFGEYGFTDYEMGGLTGSYQPLDFCVQYRETALAFISRWMEELGIFYFFRHEANRHVMVLGDHNRVFKPVVEKDALFGDHSGSNVSRWRHSYQFRSGRYAHKDFAFKTPSQDLLTKESSLLKLQRASAFEVYDYPGGYTQKGDGQQLIRLRMEEHEAAYHTVAGASICASFFAGGKFTMAQHHIQAEEKQEYVLLHVAHRASDHTYITADASPPSYDNTFEAFPAVTQFRPASRTPWPTVQGPQTATVVGPHGEQIYTDKHGRVKVQFHWDRRGKRDERSSCWVRVSQNWAGKGWGGVFIPHVGHEVVVSYQEGDPDMPLVTGRVYNGENSKAIDLPANKTQSSIQDHSGNSILMEGKGGSQKINVHAVKDMDVTVDNDRTTYVKAKLTETIDKGHELTVHKGYKETITEGATSDITGGLKSTVNGPWESTVNDKLTEKITGGEDRTVSSGRKLTVTGGLTEEVTGEHKTTVTGAIKQSSSATTDIHATGAGTYTSEASLKLAVAGSVIEITPSAITISAAGSTVKLDASGVAISGAKISLNG
jgi:type VI secretion system secreted protein VgrG